MDKDKLVSFLDDLAYDLKVVQANASQAKRDAFRSYDVADAVDELDSVMDSVKAIRVRVSFNHGECEMTRNTEYFATELEAHKRGEDFVDAWGYGYGATYAVWQAKDGRWACDTSRYSSCD